MNPNRTDLKAELIEGKACIPVHIHTTTKYSFLVASLNGRKFDDGDQFSNFVVQLNGDAFELGGCRILPEPNNGNGMGRLIFVDNVYDLETLVSHHRLVKLQDAFFNLSLILERKDLISRSFREYTSNLTYDLSAYKNIFDNLDAEYSGEPAEVKNSLQDTIIHTEGRKFLNFLDDKLFELERIVKDFNKAEHECHGFYFRRQLWEIIMGTPFMARTNLKPRGYAGDSEMMSMIYANDYMGASTFYKLMHKHPLEQPGAQAVRNRRNAIAKMICNIKERHQKRNHRRLKILSVACGPSKELADVIRSAEDSRNLYVALLDQDSTALQEAQATVRQIEKKLDTKIAVKFLNESVRTMLATPQIDAKLGQFHFIYSMGLFDYLTPPVAAAVLAKLYQLLKTGGEMVIGNFHVSNPSRHYMAYWLDWVLYYRTEEDFRSLLKDVSNAEVGLFFEENKVQMFLHVKKAKRIS